MVTKVGGTGWRIELTELSRNNIYTMYPINSIDDSLEKPTISMSLPGTSYSENPLMGLEGQESSITVDFTIWDNGEDRGSGNNIISVSDQLDYLKNTIFEPDFDAKWELSLYYLEDEPDEHANRNYRLYEKEQVLIDSHNLPVVTETSFKWIEGCRMEFVIGEPIL